MLDERQMSKRQQVLADFGDFALRSEDIDEVLTEACRLVGAALGTDRAKVLEIQEGRSELLVRAGVGWGPNVVGQVRLQMSERSSETFSIREGKPVISQDIRTEERFEIPDFMKEAGVVAMVNAPIFMPGWKPYGLLQADADRPRDFGKDDIEFLRTYTTILGPVIDRLQKILSLRASEERFRAYVTASSDVVYRMSADWSEMRQLDGRGFLVDTGVPSKGWLETYILPEDQSMVLSAIGRAISAKHIFELEHRVRRADGGVGWTLSRAVPLLDGAGDVAEWLSSAKDVTDRRLVEDSLRRSEALRRIAIDGGGMGTWRWDLRERLVWGDARFLALWGLPPSDEAHALSSFVDRMSPSGAAEMGEMVAKATAADEEFDGQLEIVAGPTAGNWVRWRGRAEPERPWIVNGVSFDVTVQRLADDRLRESEERHRLTIELVPALLWTAHPTGRDIAIGDRWQIYTGQSEAAAQDYGWLAAVHPDDREATRAAFAHAFATGEPIKRQQRIHQAENGYRWHLVRHVPVRDETGVIVRWFGAAIDVHDLHELQDRQQVLVAELQHRTRNLIAVVRGVADDTMDETGPTHAFRDAFFERLETLSRVQGLLSRSEAEPITIGTLVRLELNAIGARTFDGRVSTVGPDVHLKSSTVQTLALALHELATNARKYGALSHEAGRLAVSWRERTEAGEPRLVLDWIETGREDAQERPATPKAGGGYGRELIEQALPHAMGARTSYALTTAGLSCSLDIPVRSNQAKGTS